jgi:DNA mismatch endonuclease, patch repair protein
MPKTNTEFWQTKLSKNVLRDEDVQRQLGALGWQICVIWECEIEKNLEKSITPLTVLLGDE